jgi:hypothetical protein
LKKITSYKLFNKTFDLRNSQESFSFMQRFATIAALDKRFLMYVV